MLEFDRLARRHDCYSPATHLRILAGPKPVSRNGRKPPRSPHNPTPRRRPSSAASVRPMLPARGVQSSARGYPPPPIIPAPLESVPCASHPPACSPPPWLWPPPRRRHGAARCPTAPPWPRACPVSRCNIREVAAANRGRPGGISSRRGMATYRPASRPAGNRPAAARTCFRRIRSRSSIGGKQRAA